MKAVKEERSQWDLLPHRFDLFGPAKPSHRGLKRLRPSIRSKCNRLSLQNRLTDRQSPHPFRHIRQSFCYLLKLSGEDFYFVSSFMDLNPRPVQLEFKGGLPEPLQRLADILGGIRQHRGDRPKQAEVETRKPGGALFQRRTSNLTDISGEHPGLTHLR